MTGKEYDAWRAKIRRNELANAGVCINARNHGQATHGVRCEWCDAVHRFGFVKASEKVTPPTTHRLRRMA